MIEYTPWSPRSGGHTWEDATSYSYPIEEVLNWYWPQFSGILDKYWGRNGIHFHSDYFGVVVLILGGAAFGSTTRRNFRRFWIGAFIVSLIWAFGGNTPAYHLIILVPYTKYLRAPSTMIYITSFATSMFVAMGVERLAARRVSPKYPLAWLGIAAAAFALLMSVGGYTALSSERRDEHDQSAYGPQYVDLFRADAAENQRRRRDSRRLAIVLLRRARRRRHLGAALTGSSVAKNAAIGLAALLVADLWSIERLYWSFSPPASVVFATDPAIEAIKADMAKNGPAGRVLAAPFGQGIATELG